MALWKDSVSTAVVALGHLGEVERAFSLVQGLENHILDYSVFHHLLKAALVGGKPKDVYGVFHFAHRSGLVDDQLCSKAIIAYSEVNKPGRWQQVEEYMKKMESVQAARLDYVSDIGMKQALNPKKYLIQNNTGRAGMSAHWWVDPLVSGGMDAGLKHVFCKMCKG